MNEDIFRYLCATILKLTNGQPVNMSRSDLFVGFELKLEDKEEALVVQVVESDDELGDEGID